MGFEFVAHPFLMRLTPSDVLAAYFSRGLGVRFVLGNSDLDPREVFSSHFILPLLARMAESESRILFGQGISAQFRSDPSAMFCDRVEVDSEPSTATTMLLVHAATTLLGEAPGAVLDLSKLYAQLSPAATAGAGMMVQDD